MLISFSDRQLQGIEKRFAALPDLSRRASASAIKSEGWRLKGLIQNYIATGTWRLGWPQLNPHTGVLSRRRSKEGLIQWVKNYRKAWKGQKGSKKRVREYKKPMLSTRLSPLLRLRGAVRYRFFADQTYARIGFINTNQRLAELVKRQAEGYATTVTPRMRRMLFSMGFPIGKGTTVLRTPGRPLVEPVFAKEADRIRANLATKFVASLRRYLYGGQKAGAGIYE